MKFNDPRVQQTLLDCIAYGMTVQDSCAAAGVSKRAYYHWLGQARDALRRQAEGEDLSESDKQYIEFLEAVKQARALKIRNLLKQIEEHGQRSWQALAWILERTEPAMFAQRREVTNWEATRTALIRMGLTPEDAEQIVSDIVRQFTEVAVRAKRKEVYALPPGEDDDD
jgi:AcrR family transcriptional regulator